MNSQLKKFEAERDAQQTINLLNMALNMKNDFYGKMKRQQVSSVERTSIAQGSDNSKIKLDTLNFREITETERRREYLSMLKKYRVDHKWLKEKKTEQLSAYLEAQKEKLHSRAKEIENQIPLQEMNEVLNKIKA